MTTIAAFPAADAGRNPDARSRMVMTPDGGAMSAPNP